MKDYDITLRTTLPSACYGDSTRTIRVAPLPGSDFLMDTLLYDCERMNMRFEAVQKGLSEYTWTVLVNNSIIYGTTSTNDFLEYNFNRVNSLNQNVQVRLVTKNFANCESPVTTKGFIVPQFNNITASFVASPTSQTLPNSTVSIINT